MELDHTQNERDFFTTRNSHFLYLKNTSNENGSSVKIFFFQDKLYEKE